MITSPDRAILLTAHGAAAIAVVRITGSGVTPFLASYFSRSPRAMRCVHAELRDRDQVLDDIVVVLSEDGLTADLNLHGGPWVIESVLQLLRREGFEIVESSAAGPAPLEAFDAATELDREMLASLPLARTEAGIRALLAQPDAWKRFGESKPSADVIRAVLEDRSLWHLLHPPRVAIVGPPNVGKSTLANQLFGQERSITADLPGTTRDWVGEIANIDGLPVMLVDTPGQRTTHDEIERTAIERSRGQIEQAELIVEVRDPAMTADWWYDNSIRVMNKVDVIANLPLSRYSGRGPGEGSARLTADNPSRPPREPSPQPSLGVPGEGVIPTIATSGAGLDELRLAIRQFFGSDNFLPNRPRWWTERQRDLLHSAIADPSRLRLLLD